MPLGLKYLATSAKLGHRGAQCVLGLQYFFGSYVEQNDKTVLKLLFMAADGGDSIAQAFVGSMHSEGRGGILRNENIIKKYYYRSFTDDINNAYMILDYFITRYNRDGNLRDFKRDIKIWLEPLKKVIKDQNQKNNISSTQAPWDQLHPSFPNLLRQAGNLIRNMGYFKERGLGNKCINLSITINNKCLQFFD